MLAGQFVVDQSAYGRITTAAAPRRCAKLAIVDRPIQVEGLRKNFGDTAALKGIDFEVRAGEAFGLLGPDGAGKTTTVEILAGMRSRSGGRATVLDCDPAAGARQLKDRVGVCLQSTNLPAKIAVREALELFASLYTRAVDCGQLLKRVQLWDERDARCSRLPAGQMQRLALALALVNDPQVLLLDEPTAGLDAAARGLMHGLLGDLRKERRTMLLATRDIEEADLLCDRMAILHGGRIVSTGTPREIRQRAQANSSIEMVAASPLPGGDLPRWAGAEAASIDDGRTHIAVTTSRPARTMVEMMRWMDENGILLADIRVKRPTLGDAFRELTGKSPRG